MSSFRRRTVGTSHHDAVLFVGLVLALPKTQVHSILVLISGRKTLVSWLAKQHVCDSRLKRQQRIWQGDGEPRVVIRGPSIAPRIFSAKVRKS
jgi:hypothetical protein